MLKSFTIAAVAFGLLSAPLAASAQTAPAAAAPTPIVVYDDALGNGWQSWSWAKVQFQVPAGNVQPIKVEGEPWQALAFHHDPISTKGYTKLTFFINGGTDGGQSIAIKVLVGGKAVDSNYVIQPKVKAWAKVEVPLKDIGGADTTIDGIWFQGQAEAFKPYYVDKIKIE